MYRLKKSLGQHFLTDENICKKIVQALLQHPFHNLLEVGPGGGALTKYLLALPGVNFRTVEIDEEKVNYLLKKFPSLQGRIVKGSFLEMEKPFADDFTVVGNFPYNISTEILFKVLEWKETVQCVLGMFQKEVAQRIASPRGSKVYGVTSVLLQAFFEVEYLFDVQENSFEPPPKVKSAVIRLLPRKEELPLKNEKAFFTVVKAAFNQRRKTLRNALKDILEASVLKDSSFNRRAEELSVEEFAALSFKIK